jgi:ATP-dependent protease ClpP protease subunit
MRYNLNADKRIKLPTKTLGEAFCFPAYVSFVGEFNEDSAKKFRDSLEMAENVAKEAEQEIIPIVIDSYGGTVYALLSMIDAIKNCSLPVATIVESKAMSCGAYLFAYGAEGHRYIGPRATVMIHPVSSMSYGKIDDIKATTGESDRLNKLVFKELDENCGKEEDYFLNELKERRMADWHLTPEDCVKHGLANHIHLPSLNVDIEIKIKFG